MSGVDILSFEEVVVSNTFNYELMKIMIIIIMSIACIVGIILSIKAKSLLIFVPVFLTGVFSSVIVSMLIVILTIKPFRTELQYKVTTSDEVSLNEFNERYEIIDQEGKIYTVREK